MWIKFVNYVERESFSQKYAIGFNQIYNEYANASDGENDEIIFINYKSDGTPYLVHQIKKDIREREFASILDPSILNSFIGDYVNTKTIIKKKREGYFNKTQSIYQRFFGYEYENTTNKLDTVVFDLKKKTVVF